MLDQGLAPGIRGKAELRQEKVEQAEEEERGDDSEELFSHITNTHWLYIFSLSSLSLITNALKKIKLKPIATTWAYNEATPHKMATPGQKLR